ncbi:hypothetical protein [Leptospira perdikensis]|uniref:Uncharacterized protein n=1 Tax=Leptospira perdikensis TaxID=2484948 RepID=A0A4R9JKF6_9LEPT|nr:hypothetical protein [Leptospira perdikensis]TGL45190.1 hypothetical protein EHQ49_06970 [Leptospira perdikensis]
MIPKDTEMDEVRDVRNILLPILSVVFGIIEQRISTREFDHFAVNRLNSKEGWAIYSVEGVTSHTNQRFIQSQNLK